MAEENSKGSWHGWEMSREGPVSDAHVYSRGKEFSTSVLAGDVVVKHQNEDEQQSAKSDEVPF